MKRRGFFPFDRHRKCIVPFGKLKELFFYRRIFRHAEHHRVIRPRADDIQSHLRIVMSVNIVKQKRRGFIPEIAGCTRGGAQVRLRFYLFVDG